MKKKTILLLFAILLSFSGFSQSFESYSIEQLNQLKKEAIKNEKFDEAQRIKTEIESRKEVSELIAETKKEMEVAAANEDYSKAAKLKSKLSKLEQIKELDTQIAEAAANENFETAQKLKIQKQQLWNDLNKQNSGTTSASKVADNPTNTSGSNILRFENYLNNKLNPTGPNYFDVIIDNKYVGTINKYYELEVSNINSGEHQIVLIPIYATKGNKSRKHALKSTFVTSSNKTYSLKFQSFKRNKDFLKAWERSKVSETKEEIYTITESENSNSKNTVVYNSLENPTFESNNPLHADFQYSKVLTNLTTWANSELPEDRESGYLFNWDVDFTLPIIRNTGAIFTIGLGQSAYNYEIASGFEDYTNYLSSLTTTLHAGVGYQLEPSPYITLQTQFRLNVGWNMFNSTTWAPSSVIGTTTFYSANYVSDNTFPVTGSYHIAGLFFFDEKQTFGLVSELNVAFSSGGTAASFSLGIVFSTIKSPSQQYRKYKGKTLKY